MMMQFNRVLTSQFVIIELGVAEHIVDSYCTAHFRDGGGGALHALVFSVEFVGSDTVTLRDPYCGYEE